MSTAAPSDGSGAMGSRRSTSTGTLVTTTSAGDVFDTGPLLPSEECSVKLRSLWPRTADHLFSDTLCSHFTETVAEANSALGCEQHTACSNHTDALAAHIAAGGCNAMDAAPSTATTSPT
ncbi:hypothetical protein IAT40_005463 [Kwoniella sp. CBS 6097]